MNQRGFATLEVILMVTVIAILASIAVPRFTNITARANTAKIQADLSTIDTAIAIYRMEKSTEPADINALVTNGYLQAAPTPPSGKCYYAKNANGEGDNSSTTPTLDDIPSGGYNLKDVEINGVSEKRAALGSDKYTAENFYVP